MGERKASLIVREPSYELFRDLLRLAGKYGEAGKVVIVEPSSKLARLLHPQQKDLERSTD